MAFQLAQLFVDIKARDAAFKGQLAETRQALSAWGVAAGTAVGGLAAQAIAGATSAITGFFTRGIEGAIGLKEAMSRVNVVFGDSAGTITKFADEVNAKVGTSKQLLIDSAVQFGQSFKVAGASAGEAAKLGTQIAKLGLDLASFYEQDPAEAFTALSAALRGETDPLERFGVKFKAEEVAARAVADGLAQSTKEVSNLAKAHAALSIIMDQTTDQQGDLERNADSTSIQWRKLQGAMEAAAVAVGSKLEPAINAAVHLMNEIVGNVIASTEVVGGAFDTLVARMKEGVETIGFVWRNAGAIWRVAQLQATEYFANIVVAAETAGSNIATIAGWIGENWYQLIADGFGATATVFTNFASNLGNLAAAVWEFFTDPTGGFSFEWTPLLEGFEATVSELPKLAEPVWVDMGEQINDVLEDVGRREEERNRAIAESKKIGTIAAARSAGAAAAAKTDFKSDMLGAADYAFKLRANILGGDDTARKHLAAAEKTEKHTAKLADAADRRPVSAFA